MGKVTKADARVLCYRAINPPLWQKNLADTLEAARGSKEANPRRLDVDVSYPGLSRISADPPMYAIDNFLSEGECDAMLAAGSRGSLKPSTISDTVRDVRARMLALTITLTSDSLSDMRTRAGPHPHPAVLQGE